MPRFGANISMLFTELSFVDRIGAARAAGFAGVECHFPYDEDADAIAEALSQHDMDMVLFNLPVDDEDAHGLACMPGRREEFEDGVHRAVAMAKALGCRQLNCLVGVPPATLDADVVRRTVIDNLRFAARQTGMEGIKLLVEPLNDIDIPGYGLTSTEQAVQLVRDVGSTNLWLQYDAYHMQIMEGDLGATIESNLRRIAHIQIADVPGRNQPGTGEINFDNLLQRVDRLGYDGWIGCEFIPEKSTHESLDWMGRWLPTADAA